MGQNHKLNENDEACRKRYVFLANESQKGLDFSKILRSAKEECHFVNGNWFLKPETFVPTGIALGNPIPDRVLTKQLWELVQLLEKTIRKEIPNAKKFFGYVPPGAYHISVVHHSHFEHSSQITKMSDEEKETAQSLIFKKKMEPISIQVRDLILTPEGRLIVPGFPADDRIYRLRELFADNIPSLAHFVPNTAHIKLGHILAPVGDKALHNILDWVDTQGRSIDSRLDFHDLFSPSGRISLIKRI